MLSEISTSSGCVIYGCASCSRGANNSSIELGVKTASVEFRFSFSIEFFFKGAAGFECVLKQLACVAL